MNRRLFSEGKSLVVVGSQNDNPLDRVMDRSAIRSIQILDDDMKFQPVVVFDQWGECGVSSLAIDERFSGVIYVATSKHVIRVDCVDGTISDLAIPGLVDVHELTITGSLLWVANTGRDEVICYDLSARSVARRISLREFVLRNARPPLADEEVVDTFHCNQFFESMGGDHFVLVHHTEGRQILKRIAQRLLKSQGTGGVLNIRTGDVVPLNLKAPHSVRRCGEHYTILDSGHFLLRVYDRDWNLLNKINTTGFGRGADVDQNAGIYYAGVSATRKRYLDVLPRGAAVNSMVLFVTMPEFEVIHQREVPDIEQINNVYLISHDLRYQLLNLAEKIPATVFA